MNSRRLAIATSFGVAYFAYRTALTFLPPPIPDLFILPILILLTLSNFLVGLGGATYSAVVAGLLFSLVQPAFFPFSIMLAALLGITIDLFLKIFRAKHDSDISLGRTMLALALSSSITGLVAFYSTVTVRVVPYIPIIDTIIVAVGIISGAIGGFLAIKIWKRYIEPL